MQDNANHRKKLCPRTDLKKSLCSGSKPSKVTKIFTTWPRTSSQHSSTSRVQTWSQQFERTISLQDRCRGHRFAGAQRAFSKLTLTCMELLAVSDQHDHHDQRDQRSAGWFQVWSIWSPWSSMVPCPWSTFKELASDNRPRWPSPSTVSNMQTLPSPSQSWRLSINAEKQGYRTYHAILTSSCQRRCNWCETARDANLAASQNFARNLRPSCLQITWCPLSSGASKILRPICRTLWTIWRTLLCCPPSLDIFLYFDIMS